MICRTSGSSPASEQRMFAKPVRPAADQPARAGPPHSSRTLRAMRRRQRLLDPNTGLLTQAAFSRDFATAVYQTQSRGSGLSVARFAFDAKHPRAQRDGARIISRLMRQMDFGAVHDDGSVVRLWPLKGSTLRTAHSIARRLSSVMVCPAYQPRHSATRVRNHWSSVASHAAAGYRGKINAAGAARRRRPNAPRRECFRRCCGTTLVKPAVL